MWWWCHDDDYYDDDDKLYEEKFTLNDFSVIEDALIKNALRITIP